MENINNFNSILQSFHINAQCVNYEKIDNYFHYDLRLNANTKIKDIQKNSDEISLALKAPGKPSFKILHEQGIVRLEFASHRDTSISLFDYLRYDNNPLNCFLGKQSNGQHLYMDLSQNPHMLIAGTTGSGKSILLHNIICNLLFHNMSDIFLIDPKNIEFCHYENKFENVKVFYDYPISNDIMACLIEIMECRYQMLKIGHHSSTFKPIVVIIDEFSDLIMQDQDQSFYKNLCKLAQKCRAAKIYIILSTQRPSANIVSGTIKANFPARISCKVSSYIDSKVILDSTGAENLLGKGDALIKDSTRNLDRFQIAYASPEQNLCYFGK